MATAAGIVIVDGTCHKLLIHTLFRTGHGECKIRGPVGEEFKLAFMAAFNALHELEDYLDDFDIGVFAEKDLQVNVRIPDLPNTPVVGESYGLALAMSIIGAATNRPLPTHIAFLGCLGPAGEVLPVGGLAMKRAYAKRLGFSTVMIPTSQLDMMNREITQAPFATISEEL